MLAAPLTAALLLAGCGGVVGLVTAMWSLDLLVSLAPADMREFVNDWDWPHASNLQLSIRGPSAAAAKTHEAGMTSMNVPATAAAAIPAMAPPMRTFAIACARSRSG